VTHRDAEVEAAIRDTSRAAAALLIGAVAAAVAAVTLTRRSGDAASALVAVAATAGPLGLVGAYRWYVRGRDEAASGPADQRLAEFRRATLRSLAVSHVIALGGAAAHVASGNALALVAVATHVLLTAVVWPTRERAALFLGA
jgi:hypothetical protein